jgi:hypothetical protein
VNTSVLLKPVLYLLVIDHHYLVLWKEFKPPFELMHVQTSPHQTLARKIVATAGAYILYLTKSRQQRSAGLTNQIGSHVHC